MSNRNLPQLVHNGQPSLKARSFILAFCPPKPQTNLTQLWSAEASQAIGTLIDFRSALHRWQAAGRVDHEEFVQEVQRLDDAGLSDWMDGLIASAMVADLAGISPQGNGGEP